MKYILTLFMVLLYITGCSQKESSIDGTVVKVITTRAFSAKQHFENLIPDMPIHNLGYDQTMGLDWSCRRVHYDKYDNILRLEKITTLQGKEVVYETIYSEYSSATEHKLASRTTTRMDGKNEAYKYVDKYIRSDDGRLLKVLMQNGSGNVYEKKIYQYNEIGQKIKIDTYKEDGLVKEEEFFYDLMDKKNGRLIRYIEERLDNKSKDEHVYDYSKEGDLISDKKKHFASGVLLSEYLLTFSDFYKGEPNHTVIEGYDPPRILKYEDGREETIIGVPFRTVEKKRKDSMGNIIEFISTREDKDKNNRSLLDEIFENNRSRLDTITENIRYVYRCEYTYNDRNEWKQLLFTIGSQKFIIIRDIEYINK